jgi:DNA-binding transcriptional LysR family regulator
MRELRNIEIFTEVANCQSFSKAAKNLLLTPSAVSMSIQKLESVLGTRLLTRTTRQLHLTADGLAFLQHAQEGLSKIYEAIDLFVSRDGPPSGPLRISAVSTIGRGFILPVLSEFLTQYPDISLEFSLRDRLPDMIKEKIDLGLCYGEPDHCSYVGRYLCSPPTVLVASPGYLAAHGTPARPEDLSAHKTINVHIRDGVVPSWTLRERLSLASAAREPIVIQPVSTLSIVENHESAIDAAVAGLGIALVLRKSAASHIKLGALCPLLATYDISVSDGRRVFLVYPTKKYLPARVRVFIDFLVNVSRRDGWSGGPSIDAPVEEAAVLSCCS